VSKPLRVDITICNPACSYGGELWANALSCLLEEHLTGYGSTFDQIDIDVNFPSKLGPLEHFEQHWVDYHENLKRLPQARLHREKRHLKLEVHAGFASAEEALNWHRDKDTPAWLEGSPEMLFELRGVRPEYIPALADTVLGGLSLLNTRIKPTDDFDVYGFLAAALALKSELPTTESEARALVDRRRARHQALSEGPWAAVDVDWVAFHPDARELLDDPWFWDSVDDLAPHGNDAGARVLVSVTGMPENLWQAVMDALDQFAASGLSWLEAPGERVHQFAESNPPGYIHAEQVLIATAFAEMKVRGCVSEHAFDMTRLALERLGTPEMLSFWSGHLAPEAQDEWRKRRDQMEAKLKEVWSKQHP
jgi:uncharacterized protein YfeS